MRPDRRKERRHERKQGRKRKETKRGNERTEGDESRARECERRGDKIGNKKIKDARRGEGK